MKCFFCKEKGHARNDCPNFSAWLAEKKTVGHERSANAIEEDGWIFALDHEHEGLCELSMIDSGASVHVCPPEHGQENERSWQIESSETIVDGTKSGNETARNETGELRHGGWKGHDRLSRVGCETTDLVVGVQDGLKLRCALNEGSLLDVQR